jgi:hypothetical protein
MDKIRSDKNPIVKLLKNGYFFDTLYERVTANAVLVFSGGVKFVEEVGFEVFPQAFAKAIIRVADGLHKYFDVAADQLLTAAAGRTLDGASKVKTVDTLADKLLDVLTGKTLRSAAKVRNMEDVSDKLLDVLTGKTLRSAAKARNTPKDSLQHYLAAAIIGFIMLVILVIISIGV